MRTFLIVAAIFLANALTSLEATAQTVTAPNGRRFVDPTAERTRGSLTHRVPVAFLVYADNNGRNRAVSRQYVSTVIRAANRTYFRRHRMALQVERFRVVRNTSINRDGDFPVPGSSDQRRLARDARRAGIPNNVVTIVYRNGHFSGGRAFANIGELFNSRDVRGPALAVVGHSIPPAGSGEPNPDVAALTLSHEIGHLMGLEHLASYDEPFDLGTIDAVIRGRSLPPFLMSALPADPGVNRGFVRYQAEIMKDTIFARRVR